MTPKEKRERLFNGNRTSFRRMGTMDGDHYHKDIAICWIAHSKQPFYSISATDQNGFAKELIQHSEMCEHMIAEDRNSYYESGQGPIALLWIGSDGWKVEPHCVFFPWATARNKLRATVAFFQMARYRKVGACVVFALEDSRPLFDKTASYGVLHYVGKIPNGDPRGDEYVYSIRGKL